MKHGPIIIIIMGVSGSGKSTIGRLLAIEKSFAFYEADDFHTKEAISKMSGGAALSDDDRAPWLHAIQNQISRLKQENEPAVIACSALKKSYRQLLRNCSSNITFIHLKGSKSIIAARLKKRRNHFMPHSLLDSQLETLEEPSNALQVDINEEPPKIVNRIISFLLEEH